MKSWVLLSILSVLLLSTGWAHAGPADRTRAPFETLLTEIPMPPEWEGIWATVDSVYQDWPTPSVSFSSSERWICTGQDSSEPWGNLDCTGTATATTLHFECSGSAWVDEYCWDIYGVLFDATRDGDSFHSVTMYWVNYRGSDCAGGDSYTKRTHGTRTGPVPEGYCATPTLPATWGGVKALYR